MKKCFLLVVVTLIISSCQNDDPSVDSSFSLKAVSADYPEYPIPIQTVTGDITTNTTWTKDKVWEIDGIVRVKSGAVLTIEAGTFIKARPAAFGVMTGVLVITRTGKINAQGTPNAPIIFTSYRLLDRDTSTTAISGDFGGIVILGDAQVNTQSTANTAEGLPILVSDYYYGGTNDNHNGGILNYVRVEFGGFLIDSDSGLGAVTLAGVGRNTTVDHVQVSYSRDDSFDFFGGTVNAGHLVAFATYDDSFDFNLGYTGTITKAISIADKNSSHSNVGFNVPDSNGIELDNNPQGISTTLITRPVISQLSIIGVSSSSDAGMYENGIHVRRLGQISLSSVTVTGYNTGVRWEVPSVPSSSAWSLLSIHGFVNPILPVGTIIGLGSSLSTANPATKWGLTQPFFNDAALDFTGTTGAFRTESLWTNTWTKFTNF
ncbi:hypothetical protein [Flavobacterium gelatinilyticum]|uniref:hypothetical protein n=1 Tax=Flavobacterium gelatinilyticum TaxID=3003260 RepID=UPI00248039E2|nr:hypothetical protein [Flavobacterium gelatinilyticum]